MPRGIYKRTEYHNQISVRNGFKKGMTPWNKNKKNIFHHSEETKETIKQKMIDRDAFWARGKHISNF